MPKGESGTVAHFALERLREHGVQRIYGYPGDGINGFLGALHESEMEFVQTRHEEIAAFAACAHAKLTGEVGVCMATSGPGAIHLLNGLYDAKLDHQPVVAIVGQQKRAALGGHYQQEVDLISLFKDVAGEYVHMCSAPEQMRQRYLSQDTALPLGSPDDFAAHIAAERERWGEVIRTANVKLPN